MNIHTIDLPLAVACPTCGATGLKIQDHYSEPDDVPIEMPGVYIRPKSVVTRRVVVPCGHPISTYRWCRATPDSDVEWTLVP